MSRKRVLSTILLTAAVAFWCAAIGCPKDPYRVAVQLSANVAKAVHEGDTTIGGLATQKQLTLDEVKADFAVLGKVDGFNGVYLAEVNGVHTAYLACLAQAAPVTCTQVQGYVAAANKLIASTQDPSVLSALRVSNPKSQARVQAIGTTITGLMNSALLIIQSIKG